MRDYKEILQDCKSLLRQYRLYYKKNTNQPHFGLNDLIDEIEKKLTSDNSDYAVTPTASPKLPSLADVKKDTAIYEITVDCVYASIKKLGNVR